MPKSLYVDPVELRAPATIHFDDIPVNAYNRTVSDERAKYGDEALVRIWRDITILRDKGIGRFFRLCFRFVLA